MARFKLGVDFGGVLTIYDNERVSHGDFRPTPDLINSVRALVVHFGARDVFIVSRAGDAVAMAAQNWLHTSGFYRETGIRPDHFHCVYYRSQKRQVCNRLGITHFVDDRWDVLRRLDCHRRYLYAEPGCTAPNGARGVPTGDRRPSNLVIGGWREVLADLGLSLAPPRPSASTTFAMPPRPSASPTVVMLQSPKAYAEPHAVDVSAVPLRKRRVGSDVVIGSAAPSTSGTATHATPTTDSHQCHKLHGDDDDNDDDMYRRRGDAAQPAAPKAPGMYRRGGAAPVAAQHAQPQDESMWPQWRTNAASALRESRWLGPVKRA